MDKSTYLFGRAVFGQLISLIDNRIISDTATEYRSDRYVKRFTTYKYAILFFC